MDAISAPSYMQRWILAARPRTLPAAVSPVLVGWAVALHSGTLHWDAALALLGVAVLLQINANLINDVVDFQEGLDTAERLGPLRVTQAGLLTPRQVWTGVGVVFALAGLLGLYLTYVSGWVVVVMGLAAFAGALAYSTGPFPLAKKGLGDLAVMLFFGFLAVCGTVFVLVGHIPALAWWGGLVVGALVTNVLVVNNLRDMPTDRQAGRQTLPVRLGYRGGEVEYLVMLVLAYLTPLILLALGLVNLWVLLPLLSLLKAVPLARKIHDVPEGRAFNPLLGDTAQLALIYSLLLAIGIALGG
jgi:1,4-dihydroxy-2-naphthoate polyprenyltransferase